MPTLFLSHSGPDKAAAIALKRRLLASPEAQAAGLRVWLDVDDLVEGKPWLAQLETAIASASAFAVIVGSGGIRNWVQAETDIALSRAIKDARFRVIPILQDSGSEILSPFVKRYHAIRDPLHNLEALQRLLRAAMDLDQDGLPVLTDAPFPGLRSMSEDWADRFFGRKFETAEVLGKLRRHPAVTIVADSGAGKSSLAMAGVGHAWRGGALRTVRPPLDDLTLWHVVTMRPAENPMAHLRSAIETAAKQMGRDEAAITGYRQALTTDPDFALRCGLDPAATVTLLIIDQAEELVTLTPPDRQTEFGQLIATLADRMGDRLRILVTLRSDHLNLVTRIAGLGPMIRPPDAQFTLRQPVDLAEIVRGPLQMAGFQDETVQATLIDLLRKDLSDRPGHLALAQMTLSLAWRDQAKHGGLLGAYAANGGARAALGNEAERIEGVLSPEDRARLMPIFIRLIRLSDIDTGATRRIAARDEFDPAQNQLIDRLAGERRGVEEFGRLVQTSATHVEIAHEALITQWPRLHEYLRTHASDLRTLSDLIRRAQDWAVAGESTKHLTTLADEERFQALALAHPDWLAPVERRFLDWSQKEHRRIEAERVRTARRIRLGTRVLAVLLVCLLAAGWFAYDRNARAAQSRVDALALLALSKAETDPVGALKLVLGAWPKGPYGALPTQSVAFRALNRAIVNTKPHILMRGHDGSVLTVAVSPDGRRIVSGGGDGMLRLWDARTGATLGEPLLADEKRFFGAVPSFGAVRSVAFAPDGRRIVSGGHDGALRLWDANTGAALGEPIRGHANRLFGGGTSVAFAPDESRIVSGGDDGTLRLWDASTGAAQGDPLRGHEGEVNSVAFALDGSRIVSGGDDGMLRLWDATTGAALGEPIRGHEGAVFSVAVSPDGRRIVSGGGDGTLRLWDASTGAALGEPMRGHDGSVLSVTFAPDGRRIVSGGTDGTLRLWDGTTGAALGEPLRGHEGWVLSAAFAPDGRSIVSAGDDGTLRLWDANTGAALGEPMRGHEGEVNSVAFAPDVRRIVSAGSDGTLRLWDAATGAALGEPLRGHEGWVSSVAFAPDGRRIVSGGSDGTLRLWDAHTGAALGDPRRGHEGEVNRVAFAPDGRRIVSGGNDGTLRLWDATTGAALGEPLGGHEASVWTVAFAPDGRRIVSGGRDGTLRLWDATTGAALGGPLRVQEVSVNSVAFSPDGRRIVSGGIVGTLRLWGNLPPGNILQVACRYLPRIDGRPDTSTDGLAAEIGIEGLTLPEDCDTYDPPLPPGLLQ